MLISACGAWSHIKNRFVRFSKGRAGGACECVMRGFFFLFFLHFSFVCNNFFLSFSACTKCVLKDLRDGGGGEAEI